jgi:hypothetical protein
VSGSDRSKTKGQQGFHSAHRRGKLPQPGEDARQVRLGDAAAGRWLVIVSDSATLAKTIIVHRFNMALSTIDICYSATKVSKRHPQISIISSNIMALTHFFD